MKDISCRVMLVIAIAALVVATGCAKTEPVGHSESASENSEGAQPRTDAHSLPAERAMQTSGTPSPASTLEDLEAEGLADTEAGDGASEVPLAKAETRGTSGAAPHLTPDPETAVHPSELLGRSDVPVAPMGLPRSESIFTGNATYEESAAHDDERESVYRGRRLVDPIDGELTNAFDTPEELAMAILEAIFFSEPARFHALRLTKAEFERYCWPEFPQSRPFTNMVAHDAWTFHEANCMDGINEARYRWPGGAELHLVNIRYEIGIQQYRNFNLYRGVVIDAVDDRGNAVVVDIAPIFVERNGKWKVYIYES